MPGRKVARMREMEKVVTAGERRFLLRVESSSEDADYQKYEDLRNEIWGFPEDHLAGTRNLSCESFLHEGTSLFIGAFVEDGGRFPLDLDHMAGFSYGFVGIRDKEAGFRDAANLRFYSQYAGVREDLRSLGLGRLIKEFQKEVLLGVYGLDRVICMFDPLTGVNAHRNIHQFGMEVAEYREAAYGEFGGHLNRGDVPKDRFLMSWDLKREFRRPAAEPGAFAGKERRVIRAGTRTFAGPDGTVTFEAVQDVDPGLEGESLLVQIPRDFYRMLRETDVDDPDVRRIPFDWRMATRQAFQALFRRGYEVTDFLRAAGDRGESFYLLKKKDP
jgi:predicted GNAT superfamily acetyltransferase